jgi:ABC-type phosphate transport system substrate-binding protein
MIRLRRRTAQLALTLLCVSMFSVTALADNKIIVIVSQNSPDFKITAPFLRDIYLKKIFLDDNNQEFIPLNLPPDHVLRQAFSLALFKKGAQELQNYWNQRYFNGVTPPYVLGSTQAVVQFVAKTPGAIGYVTPCDLDPRVKEILTLSTPDSDKEALDKLCPSTPSADNQLQPN